MLSVVLHPRVPIMSRSWLIDLTSTQHLNVALAFQDTVLQWINEALGGMNLTSLLPLSPPPHLHRSTLSETESAECSPQQCVLLWRDVLAWRLCSASRPAPASR